MDSWPEKAELAWRIKLAGHTIVNSFADHKANLPLDGFACSVIICSNELVGDGWSLPSTRELSDETREKGNIGVLPLALAALKMGCERMREVLPEAEKRIGKLEATTPRAMHRAITKWRGVTLTKAWETLISRQSKK